MGHTSPSRRRRASGHWTQSEVSRAYALTDVITACDEPSNKKVPFPGPFEVGGTGLRRSCKIAVIPTRGVHPDVHQPYHRDINTQRFDGFTADCAKTARPDRGGTAADTDGPL